MWVFEVLSAFFTIGDCSFADFLFCVFAPPFLGQQSQVDFETLTLNTSWNHEQSPAEVENLFQTHEFII